MSCATGDGEILATRSEARVRGIIRKPSSWFHVNFPGRVLSLISRILDPLSHCLVLCDVMQLRWYGAYLVPASTAMSY